MKTIQEVIAFLESEKLRLGELGTYSDDIDYLDYLIKTIQEGK